MVLNVNQTGGPDSTKGAQENDKTAVADELKKLAEAREAQNSQDNKSYTKSLSEAKHLEALMEAKVSHKAKKDPGIKVLSDLADDLAKMGIADISSKNISKSTKGKIDSEIDKMLEKTSGKEDKYDVQNRLTKDAVKRNQSKEEREKEDQQQKDQMKQNISSPEVKQAMQDYSSAYASYALASSPEAKEKLDTAEDKLRKRGFSEREIISLEKATKRSFKSQFTNDIQGSFIKFLTSKENTFEMIVAKKGLDNAYSKGLSAQGLTGLAGDRESVTQEMGRIAEVSKEEIKDFIREAVESKLMERHLSDKDNKEEIRKFVELGNKVGFNFNEFLKTWEAKKFDLGLFVIEFNNAQPAEAKGEISIGEVSTGGVGEKSGYEFTKDEEKELLVNQLRAEFMKRAITGDPFASISFAPKIQKLKNGLIKLGLVAEDFSQVEKEAKVLARYRTLEMLKDAFIERSTYYELSGPAYGLLDNKLKGLISNMEKLDMRLDKGQIEMLRDDANRLMHDHTIIELKSAIAIDDNGENPAVKKKIPLMIKLLKRLREESTFLHGVGEDDIDDIIARFDTGNVKIREDS